MFDENFNYDDNFINDFDSTDLSLDEFYEEYENNQFLQNAHQIRQISECVVGVTESLYGFIYRSLLFAFFQRLVWLVDCENVLIKQFANILVGALGIILSWQNHSDFFHSIALVYYFLISSFGIYLLRQSQWCGHICVFISFFYTVLCQFFWYNAVQFTTFRGSLMIATMKQISLAYDVYDFSVSKYDTETKLIDNENIQVFNKGIFNGFSMMFAFIFNPSAFLFGPFITFEQFFKARYKQKKSWKLKMFDILCSIFGSLQNLALSLFFVLCSSCLTEQIPDFISSNILIVFNKETILKHYCYSFLRGFAIAQSFRFSHYFVCYFASATSQLGGIESITNAKTKAIETTKWRQVEWPNSFLDVVVFWNIPMHMFLHKYIFKRTHRLAGYFGAMFITFCTSAFLHGFDFQLTAVLISLGFYAFAEAEFRRKIAFRLSACIKSRACVETCNHRHNKSSFLATAVNLTFIFINIYHLAYLGAPFGDYDHNENKKDIVGYYWQHTLNVWYLPPWHFISPLIAFVILLLSFII